MSQDTVTCFQPTLNKLGTVSYALPFKAVATVSGNITSSVSAARDSNTDNNGPLLSRVEVTRTCQVYNDNGTPYPCDTNNNFVFDNFNAGSSVTSQEVCCVSCNH